ncbi:unnamed protein product [Laminaria digitata]
MDDVYTTRAYVLVWKLFNSSIIGGISAVATVLLQDECQFLLLSVVGAVWQLISSLSTPCNPPPPDSRPHQLIPRAERSEHMLRVLLATESTRSRSYDRPT